MALSVGDKLGPYEILAPIGAGGMGEVYRARDTRLGRDVALKILPDHLANDSDRRARFENEARAASALNYPGIVTIHDIGNADGVAYLVSEFIDGASLRTSRPDTVRRQIDVAAQTAEALAAAHAAGITHRDLKPENIMITRDGRVKILDFGLASQTTSPPGEETLTAMTMPGTILGTVGYMSPEQARGWAADARSDIFSLGAVLYELFSGHRAFGGESPADVLSAVLKSDPPELPSSVPPGMRQIVDRCLDKDSACRFQSTQDLAFALRAVAGSSLTGVTSPTIVERPAMKAKKVRWPLAAVGAAALVLGVGFCVWPLNPNCRTYPAIAFATLRRRMNPSVCRSGRRTANRSPTWFSAKPVWSSASNRWMDRLPWCYGARYVRLAECSAYHGRPIAASCITSSTRVLFTERFCRSRMRGESRNKRGAASPSRRHYRLMGGPSPR